MYKQTYSINIKREDVEKEVFDPNLDIALKDIFVHKHNTRTTGKFDFEIVFLYDGFISNSQFNQCFNAFLHDMLDVNEGLIRPANLNKYDEYVDYIKDFIIDYHRDYRSNINWMCLEVLRYYTSDSDGKKNCFTAPFDIPRENINIDLEILQFGPDNLMTVICLNDLFKYVFGKYYRRLYEFDLLDNKELRKLSTLSVGVR